MGPLAAVSFVIGSDILLDNLSEDIDALASMPKGSHVGELDVSFLAPELPPQFLMDYDYGFLFLLRSRVTHFCDVAHHGGHIVAHSVLDELTLYLIMRESSFLMKSMDLPDDDSAWKEWAFDLFDDCDLFFCIQVDLCLIGIPPTFLVGQKNSSGWMRHRCTLTLDCCTDLQQPTNTDRLAGSALCGSADGSQSDAKDSPETVKKYSLQGTCELANDWTHSRTGQSIRPVSIADAALPAAQHRRCSFRWTGPGLK